MLFAVSYFTISIFLAVNMGASGFSIAFTPSYASGIIKRKTAVILFSVFVTIGAVLVGPGIVETLTTRLTDRVTSPVSGLIILSGATLIMLLANLLKVPQSTSFIMVSTFTGAGLFFGTVNVATLLEIVLFAVVFSAFSFIVTYFIIRKLYPLTKKNMVLHEKVAANKIPIRKFILFTD